MADNNVEEEDDEFQQALVNGIPIGTNDEGQIYVSDGFLERFRQLRNNQPTNNNEFSLEESETAPFTNRAWRLLGRYIANNTHLQKLDLDGCLTDEKMALLFSELAKSSSLQQMYASYNSFGLVGVQNMLPFLRNANLSVLDLMSNTNINTECFEVLISALNGKSINILGFRNCNITNISALDRYHLPCLHTLNLNHNNIGREGCIILSNFQQNRGSTLRHLHLNSTGIDDEGAEILATLLKNDTKLFLLDLEENNNITESGYKALLKVVVDVSSIENTYDSNQSLGSCFIGDDDTSNMPKSLTNSACKVNLLNTGTTAQSKHAAGRAKVIKFQLNSQTLKELCHIQGVEYIPGSIFSDIEPVLLPKVLALIGSEHGHSELYTALIHTAPDLLSYIDRKTLINNEMEKVEARGAAKVAEYERKIAALKTEMLTQKADLSRRLTLIDLGDIKQSAFEEGYDEGVVDSSKKRQRS